MRRHAWIAHIALGLLLTAGAWVLPAIVDGAASRTSRIACYVLLSAAALGAILLGIRWHRPRIRAPWLLFAASQLVYLAADITFYTYHDVLGVTRFPAPADALYLGHYPLLIAGLLLMLRHRSLGRDREGLLDALIITTGVGLLAWVFLLGPYVRAVDLPLLVRATSIAYPVMDLLVALVATRLAVSGGVRPPAYWLLLAGLVSLLVADGLYGLAILAGTYEIGATLDLGWLGFYTAFGAAALHPSMTTLAEPGRRITDDRLSRPRLAAVALAALVAPVVLLVESLLGRPVDGVVIAITSAVLFGLTMLRMRSLAGRVAAHAERTRLLQRFGAIIDASPVAIVETDREQRVQLWNPAAERMYGWPSQDVLGRHHPAALEAGWPPAPPTGRTGSVVATVEVRQHHRDGSPIDVELSTAALPAPGGGRAGMISVAVDVTERRQLAEQLRHQALHDPLTGLANRALLQDRLAHALARARRAGTCVAVLLADLDGFKTVNDTLGHEVGDQLLRGVAERLADVVRGEDTVARFGGDEFVVVIEDPADGSDAVPAAHRLLRALDAPLRVAGRDVQVSMSIGIAVSSADTEPGELVRDADVAMYEAKQAGGDGYRVFDPSMRAALVDRADLEDDLRRALERDELRLHYQPLVELADGRIAGVEALLRWEHPTRGLLAPGSFIGVAEDTGLLVPIGSWVLHRACAQARAWQRDVAGGGQLGISVNISAVQLARPDLADEITRVLGLTGLHPQHLTLELTESLLVADSAATTSTLRELDRLGVRLAIDDFGTGYSSLSYLRRLPVDVLKIDKSFVDEIAESDDAAALARTIVTLATSMEMQTVAEGIEQRDQAERLRVLGCDMGQGYHFARPLPADELTELLTVRRTRVSAGPEPI